MQFPASFLDEIRDRVPISSVIGPRVTWDRKKTNAARGDFWACCPFHGEKTPSFHCEDRKGRYYCFGCQASGDHFRFLSELDGLDFPEAVERIADMAGVPMPAPDPQAQKREKEKATLHEVMELAAAFFEQQLQTANGARARSYLRGRGIEPATQQRFRLGYAPDSRNALKEYLAGKGVEKSLIEAAGLVVFGPDIAVSYDRFRDRIMFPITDVRERVIAFGGRALSSDVPAKYLNSPETALFHKGRVLYNLAHARRAAQKAGAVVAVEGYMDVIALSQAGFENAVAPLGTALTEDQLFTLWHVCEDPILSFDGDGAGLKAAWRAADLCLPHLQPGRTLRFALLPDGNDPDDILSKQGREEMARILAHATPLIDLLWMRETSAGVFETPEQRAGLEKRFHGLVATIRDEPVRRHYAQEIRERLNGFFGTADFRRGSFAGGKEYRGRKSPASGRVAVTKSLSRSSLIKADSNSMPLREAVIVVAMVNHPTLIEGLFDEIERLDLESESLRNLQKVILDHVFSDGALTVDALLTSIEGNNCMEAWERARKLVERARVWQALADAAPEDARQGLVQSLHLHKSARSLRRELQRAESALATEWSEANLQHLMDIQAQLGNTQATEALIDGFGVASGRIAGRDG